MPANQSAVVESCNALSSTAGFFHTATHRAPPPHESPCFLLRVIGILFGAPKTEIGVSRKGAARRGSRLGSTDLEGSEACLGPGGAQWAETSIDVFQEGATRRGSTGCDVNFVIAALRAFGRVRWGSAECRCLARTPKRLRIPRRPDACEFR